MENETSSNRTVWIILGVILVLACCCVLTAAGGFLVVADRMVGLRAPDFTLGRVADSFDRTIGYEVLATGGSMIVFGPKRDMLEVASHFMEFFIEESCGWCVPCRVGNVLIKERLDRIRSGKGLAEDLDYLEDLCATVKRMSRCGLGQTSPNPVQTTLANFRSQYQAKVLPEAKDGLQPAFDLNAALAEAVEVQGRQPVFHED